MAGNPFRRMPTSRLEDEGRAAPGTPQPVERNKKPKKHVKIQTPPHSPEEPPRRLSAGRLSPPPPPQSPDTEEDTDSTATADSELEEAVRNRRRNSGSLPSVADQGTAPSARAPYNPFARTLATSEAAYGLPSREEEPGDYDETTRSTANRPALNVDQFKNILLTGSATPSPPASTSAQPLQESSSTTDASSGSRQSLLDPSFDMQTPRSSFDHMDSLESASSDGEDGEHSTLMGSRSDKLDDVAPRAPPKNARGKGDDYKGPQTVSFADFHESTPSAVKGAASFVSRPSIDNAQLRALSRSTGDLDKPLPVPPSTSPTLRSATVDATNYNEASVSERRSMSTATENSASSKKAPPPPPTSRRTRAGSNTTRQSGLSDDAPPTRSPDSTDRANVPPPPPPPSRKSRSANPSTADAASFDPPTATSSSKSMPPPPPPSRNTPKQTAEPPAPSPPPSSRPGSLRNETTTTPSPVPPRPPPRRSGPRPTSIDEGASLDRRRSSAQSVDTARSTSLSSITSDVGTKNELTTPPPPPQKQPRRDILADMSAFQAEIDALRARNGEG